MSLAFRFLTPSFRKFVKNSIFCGSVIEEPEEENRPEKAERKALNSAKLMKHVIRDIKEGGVLTLFAILAEQVGSVRPNLLTDFGKIKKSCSGFCTRRRTSSLPTICPKSTKPTKSTLHPPTAKKNASKSEEN